jgi:DNA-binding NtrC family response regulator
LPYNHFFFQDSEQRKGLMGSASSARAVHRFRLLFATADDSALIDMGQELAPAFFISIAHTPSDLISGIQQNDPEIIVVDVDTIARNGKDFFSHVGEVRAAAPTALLVAISRTPLPNARRRTRAAGGDEFLLAPVDFAEMREYLLEAAKERIRRLEAERLREEIKSKNSFCGLIGGSDEMRRVYEAIRRVAPGTTTVMLRGESGTGKELVARALVSLSPRRNAPFVSVNCAALPEHLMESELFGHEKGAFTGAHASRPGQIELADGGTLFLDEIGALGLSLQSKLLRVLQDHAVQRLGGKTAKKIDFRLICATNENVEEMVAAGRFREDLYYRIQVIPIQIPALRERGGDVALLIEHFLQVFCTAHDVPMKRIEPEAMDVLESNQWPGNVRELENLVQRLVLMVEDDTIRVGDLPQPLLQRSSAGQQKLLVPDGGVDFDEEIQQIEITYLTTALQRAGGKTAAAALLRIPVQRMKYLCRKYGL